jgi:hypothetical protein
MSSGTPGLLAARGVLRPALGQIQPVGDGQAHRVIGHRQRDGDLAIGLLAELAAVLVRHADRVRPALGKARVVDDPGLDRPVPLHRRQHEIAHLAEHLRVGPFALGEKVGLMLGAGRIGCRRRRDRLRALPLAIQEQPRAVIAHRRHPGRVPHHAGNLVQIRRKTLRTVVRSPPVHRSLRRRESDASLIRSGALGMAK